MTGPVPIDPNRVHRASLQVAAALLDARDPAGHWTGHLASSALATATAVTALCVVDQHQPPPSHHNAIRIGGDWLVQNQNPDGGWGDTTLSLSNLSTTTLGWAALGAARFPDDHPAVQRAAAWITSQAGGLDPDRLAPVIIARYGKDRTFSVPILTLCALAGRLGPNPGAWNHVIPLPFELAACPRQWFAALRLPVVSYALPALIAIGQARFTHAPPRNPIVRWIRQRCRTRTLAVLQQVQPTNGGFLEATPLTSFVTMSLAGSGLADHPVVRKGVQFLLDSQRPDGSWPIDTNLATWVTTLGLNALGPDRAAEALTHVRPWLLNQQYRKRHLYTNAPPGGWAWTDLPGGVPDADDTAGALLALRPSEPLKPLSASELNAASGGLQWLLNLQNRDGGVPTFCRGWGTLPFDRSSPDITAHALRAWHAWKPAVTASLAHRIDRASNKALASLKRSQQADGSWIPLWFGNQHDPNETNKTYGTSRVLLALSSPTHSNRGESGGDLTDMIRRAVDWICAHQDAQGGWGGGPDTPASVEETALTLETLAALASRDPQAMFGDLATVIGKGTQWLLDRVDTGQWTQPAPIGFYFARLWYYESLYPMIFTVAALREVSAWMSSRS